MLKQENKKEFKFVLSKAKQKTGEQVKIVISDGLLDYSKVIKKVYGFSNKIQLVRELKLLEVFMVLLKVQIF